MIKGDKVRLNGVVSDSGKVWESLRPDWYRSAVGRVVKVETHYHSRKGFAKVEFPGMDGWPLDVPIELLTHEQ